MMVGTHKFVVHGHLDNLINLSGINIMVATHDGFVLVNGAWHIIVVIHLNKATTFDIVYACFAQCLADIGIVRGHLQLNGIFAC